MLTTILNKKLNIENSINVRQPGANSRGEESRERADHAGGGFLFLLMKDPGGKMLILL